MHELPVAQSILDITLQHARQAGAQRVLSINLVIGRLASVVDDSIQFYWDIISAGTLAEGAQLHFERVPMQLTCRDCGRSFAPENDAFACPDCLSRRVAITAGEEMRVDSIDVE